jgi:phosphate transport system permease protein
MIKIKSRTVFWDSIVRRIFLAVAFVSVLVLLLIFVFLIKEGIQIFGFVNPIKFIFDTAWYPTNNPPVFGILSLIVGSVSVTILSSFFSIPLSLAVAIFLSEMAPPFIREIVKPFIEIIASIPSVVLGFFGLVVIAPFLQKTFDLDSGWNMLNAAIMLAFMAIPTIASISEDAISAVPKSLKQASYALGANKWQTIFFVTIPAALSGISTAIILGVSRVIGETMVVLMVAGGSTRLPTSIFDPVRPMTSSIAAEMAEAAVGDLHYQALFAIGIVLFIITFCFNILADYLSNKYKFKSQ